MVRCALIKVQVFDKTHLKGLKEYCMSDIQASTRNQLKAFVERIERLEEEKAALTADIREVYAEAKSTGFDVKALRTVIRIRKQDDTERREQELVLETYLNALGMLSE